jgi:hypothetical protein
MNKRAVAESLFSINASRRCFASAPTSLFMDNGYKTCGYCVPRGRCMVHAETEKGRWSCTRKSGHPGPHVACYTHSDILEGHYVVVWDDNGEILYEREDNPF